MRWWLTCARYLLRLRSLIDHTKRHVKAARPRRTMTVAVQRVIFGAGRPSIMTLRQAAGRWPGHPPTAPVIRLSLVHHCAMAAEGRRDGIVTAGQQFAADQALGAIVAQLDLVLGVPPRIVADHRQQRQPVAHGGVEFGDVEAHRAVAHHRHHRALGGSAKRAASANGSADADGAGQTVDDAVRRLQARAGPLADLAAVGRPAPSRGGCRASACSGPQHLHGVQAAGREPLALAHAQGGKRRRAEPASSQRREAPAALRPSQGQRRTAARLRRQ